MTTTRTPTKAERREAARAQAAALREKQAAAERRTRRITLSILGAVVVVLLGIVVGLFVHDHVRTAAHAVEDLPLSEVAVVPANVRADGAIVLGPGGAAGGAEIDGVPELGVYLDYFCPACGRLEETNLQAFESFANEGTATVAIFPLVLLDAHGTPGSVYSTRATTASFWVADRAPESWFSFHVALLTQMPPQGTAGLSNDELAAIAREAGVPADVADGIATGEARRTFGQFAHSARLAFVASDHLRDQRGQFSTPTLTLDGVRWDGNWLDPDVLPQAVADATP